MGNGKLKKGDPINFLNTSRIFNYIRPLGSGGTGDIHLFEDTTTDMKFAIKKFLPLNEEKREELYTRFVEEIKILFKTSHPNIVRVYNHYLYPNNKMGYLQMEYIEGNIISDHYYFPFDDDSKDWDDTFKELISAFKYLESVKILHRDIRPANIMIDKNNNVKIIDFGFGKLLDTPEEIAKSVLLNWPVSVMPLEIAQKKEYTIQSEIYFLGKTFYDVLIEKKEHKRFKYKDILEKMIKINPNERYLTFSDVEKDINSGLIIEADFSNDDKKIYQDFVSQLEKTIASYIDEYKIQENTNEILFKLKELIGKNSLEKNIQKNNELIKIFIASGFSWYSDEVDISVDIVKNFYSFLISLEKKKQENVFNNLYSRLSKISIKYSDDEFPF